MYLKWSWMKMWFKWSFIFLLLAPIDLISRSCSVCVCSIYASNSQKYDVIINAAYTKIKQNQEKFVLTPSIDISDSC